MTEIVIVAAEVRPGDEVWCRVWFGPGYQPAEVNGWRTVAEVYIGSCVHMVMTDGSDAGYPGGSAGGPPSTIYRFPGDKVRVRRVADTETLGQNRRSEPPSEIGHIGADMALFEVT